MKIPISITETYCPDWKLWHGIRELVQNAIDADDDGYKMEIKHHGNKLTLTNRGVVLDTRVLLLGGTQGKSATARGKHREGLKIGLLALKRAGCDVNIYSGDEVWRPEIEASEQFAGQRVLVVTTRKLKTPREDFVVEVEGINKDVWTALTKRFLFIKKPNPDQTVEIPDGVILLDPDYRGCIFSRGIYVAEMAGLAQGYDLNSLELDRDRQVVQMWDFRWHLANAWDVAVQKHPLRCAKQVYSMAQSGSEEMQALRHYGSGTLARLMREALEDEHGEGAVPVSSLGEAQEVEELGGKAVVVDASFRELLEKDGKTTESMKEARRKGIKRRLGPGDIPETARVALLDVVGRVAKLTEVVVVEYNDPSVLGQYNTEDRLLQFSLSALAQPAKDLLRMAVAQVAIHRGKSVEEVYLDLLYPAEALDMKESSAA